MEKVISSKIVNIRKPHNCWGCTKLVEPPAKMEVTVSVDVEIMSAYWCSECQEKIDNMDYYDKMDGFCYGDLKENE